MLKYTVEVIHNFKQIKSYKFDSDIKVSTGDLVMVQRQNGLQVLGTVLSCVPHNYDSTGHVLRVVTTNRNKLNDIVGNLLVKGTFTVANKVYKKYITNTNANSGATIEQFKAKLARNIILATKAEATDVNYIVKFSYGSMQIYVDLLNKEVVNMTNRNPVPTHWKKNMKKYNKLNKLFEIE